MSPSATPATQKAAASTASFGSPVRHQSQPRAISTTPATRCNSDPKNGCPKLFSKAAPESCSPKLLPKATPQSYGSKAPPQNCSPFKIAIQSCLAKLLLKVAPAPQNCSPNLFHKVVPRPQIFAEARDVMSSFQPKPETENVRSLFLSFLRSVSWTQESRSKVTRYHKISQDITTYHNISQHITRYHNISQHITTYQNIS